MERAHDYAVKFARIARKELEALDDSFLSGVFRRIEALADNPRPVGCRKIRGERSLWRIRVGDYRIIYSIDDAHKVIDISTIRHRSDAYR